MKSLISLNRFETFSNGVLAIAMTLLVIKCNPMCQLAL
ncbi:MAG: TMEM175 family protein [Nostoc sp.]